MHIDNAQRRARLVRRHHLARSAGGVMAAVEGVAAQHSTDPATPYLAAWARVPDFRPEDLEAALCDERVLWRLHAMRRTLFIVPASSGPSFEAGASRAVATKERRRVEAWAAAEMSVARVKPFLAELEGAVLDVLRDGREYRTQELSDFVPGLKTPVTLGSGRWTQRAAIGSRVLYLLAMDGRIVRTRAAGSWRSSQYLWAATAAWFDGISLGLDPAVGRAGVLRRYLASHGPATLADIRWWTGWTVGHCRSALADVGATEVELDGGGGYVLDTGLEPPAEGVAFLPALDPTPMGWKERDWYVDARFVKELFDRNGNVGPTIWQNGEIVGGWGQGKDGRVRYRLLAEAEEEAIRSEAERLSSWLDGQVVIPRFATPLEKRLRG